MAECLTRLPSGRSREGTSALWRSPALESGAGLIRGGEDIRRGSREPGVAFVREGAGPQAPRVVHGRGSPGGPAGSQFRFPLPLSGKRAGPYRRTAIWGFRPLYHPDSKEGRRAPFHGSPAPCPELEPVSRILLIE